ncbi:extracellular mutant protein 11-domain-containing protein [Xylariaceae sp. FL0594]|nr:extracellular mutant protein 11-domain-containing protein [Xylariaceae sp. FL0594]
MPPATASFFKQSRTKMQAWVTNPTGLGHSQPGVAASAPASAYEPPSHSQNQAQPQTQVQNLNSNPTRHVAIPQPKLHAQTQPAQQTSPSRSRSPIVNANLQRASSAMGGRLPVPSRAGHSRDASLNLPSSRTLPSDPLQQPKRSAPFWDQSTIEGSAFSDTASNNDSNPPIAYRQPPAQTLPALTYRPLVPPRHRPAPKLPDRAGQDLPFMIGHNGLINVIPPSETGASQLNGGGLTRSASTPETRTKRANLKDVYNDNGRDLYPDDSSYNTSPEKSPSKRLQHPKTIVLRSAKRDPYTERVSFPNGDPLEIPAPLRAQPYTSPTQPEPEEEPQVQPERVPRLQVPVHPVHRSTIFADTDTPMVSHRDETDDASVEPEPSPEPVQKTKPPVNRNLFPKPRKNSAGLRESSMPRQTEQRQPVSNKRQVELDYDDGALAAMDYVALKQEAFDFDPAQAEALSVVDPPRGTLPQKLEHFFTKDEASQTDFFTKMSVNEWEESGDWFLERFGEIMDRFKHARKRKREMVNAFEEEIAEREEAVRNKIQAIDHRLAELKAEGEGMIRGKVVD